MPLRPKAAKRARSETSPAKEGGPPATMRAPSVGEALAEAAHRLGREGIRDPRRDALLLLSHATGLGKAVLLGHPERLLAPEEDLRFVDLVRRRASREPLQYIRGVQEFWGLEVAVGPGCLIPRPETEHLVEESLACLEGLSSPRVAEVGSGSGCLLMALATERPDGRFWGVDVEREALSWARRNTASLENVLLVRGDLLGPCPLRGLDLLASNPPYVSPQEWDAVAPEIRDHEPRGALLVEGPDLLGPYRRLARWAEQGLNAGGWLVAELGAAQARRARALRSLSPVLTWERGARDLAGHLRVGVWRKV